MAPETSAATAASSTWLDPDDGVRLPAGDVHAWLTGTTQTLCGLALAQARLHRFAHIPFADVVPGAGSSADAVEQLCPGCAAEAGVDAGRWSLSADARR